MPKYKLLLMLLLVSSSLFVAGCIDEDLSAEQIAEKMQQKQDGIEDYSYTIYMTMEFDDQKMVTEADRMYKKPNKFKAVHKQPAEMAGSVTVSDGETMWTYDSQQNTVMIMELPEMPEQDYLQFIEMMMDESDFSLESVEKFDGRTAYIIDMASKDESDWGMKMWVDKETWMPLKMEMKDADGNLMYSIEYRNFQTNTGIPDEEFQFEIPEGAEVKTMEESMEEEKITIEEAQANASFDILEPTYLPSGYEFDNVYMADPKHNDTMKHLTYTNGKDSFELVEDIGLGIGRNLLESAENVTINGQEGKLLEGGRSLFWTIGDIGLIIHSGSLSKDEMIRIAESVG